VILDGIHAFVFLVDKETQRVFGAPVDHVRDRPGVKPHLGRELPQLLLQCVTPLFASSNGCLSQMRRSPPGRILSPGFSGANGRDDENAAEVNCRESLAEPALNIVAGPLVVRIGEHPSGQSLFHYPAGE
jgi:hypothetical protein